MITLPHFSIGDSATSLLDPRGDAWLKRLAGNLTSDYRFSVHSRPLIASMPGIRDEKSIIIRLIFTE